MKYFRKMIEHFIPVNDAEWAHACKMFEVKRVKKGTTILCSDGHHSYKGFAKDSEMELHVVNASKGERVKGKYHIQHVNATHNRVKKWIENTFWGVSTKYLQQ